MLDQLGQTVLSLTHTLPLEWYALIASFLEEVIAPIPSSAVLLSIGSIAAVQELTIIALIPLLLISTLGKTLGAIIIYYCASTFGTVLVTKYGKFFGTSPASIETFGARLNSSRYKYLTLVSLRALPIFPSAVLSIGCGILKIRFQTFVFTTVVGTLVRDAIFIYVGFTGTSWLSALTDQSTHLESIGLSLTAIGLIAGVGFLLYKKLQSQS